jgi:hypothetical protein
MPAINSVIPDRLCPRERRFRAPPCCRRWPPSLSLGFVACALIPDVGGAAADAGKNKAEAAAATHGEGTSPSPRTPSFASFGIGVDQ